MNPSLFSKDEFHGMITNATWLPNPLAIRF